MAKFDRIMSRSPLSRLCVFSIAIHRQSFASLRNTAFLSITTDTAANSFALTQSAASSTTNRGVPAVVTAPLRRMVRTEHCWNRR